LELNQTDWSVQVIALLAVVVATVQGADAGVEDVWPGGRGGVSGAYCPGEYADDFSTLPARIRDLEQRQPAYTFCVRTRATYECPSYDSEGNLRRTRKTAVAHGTAFAYQVQNGETLLLTNHHVAEWPVVTDDEHHVDEVPAGCKRVSDSLKLVDNDSDDYEPDDISLSRVVSDPQLDMAVLKAHSVLPTLPWKIGRSAGLRERNIVDIRGFPLGAFKATNEGKVISAYDRDEYRDWSHDDFVIDALLSQGNSGSPVLAMSCKTGEFELVGVFHAGYTRGSALNVVVGIEQIRDLMTTLKRSPRRDSAPPPADTQGRLGLMAGLRASSSAYFPFGGSTALASLREDGAVVFEVLNHDFPLRSHPVLVVEDLPGAPGEFGALGRVWFGNALGLKRYSRSDLDAEAQGLVVRVLDALRRDAQATLTFQAIDREAGASRERHDQVARLERALRKTTASRQDLSQLALDAAERLAPVSGELPAPLFEALTPRPAATSDAGATGGPL
jgi:serine protease Do